jgi:hypothetical protein
MAGNTVKNKPRKGVDAERVPISWGKFKVKINGKQTTVDATSRIQRGLFTKLGLPQSTTKGSVKVVKDKRGVRILKAPSQAIGSKVLKVSFNEYTTTKVQGKTVKREVWYNLRLPVYVSAASASILLRKAGKVKKIKWENGRVFDFTVA